MEAGNFDLLWAKTPFGQKIKKIGWADPDQLFDLRNDPDEQHNLADHPECQQKMAEMKKHLSRYVQSIGRPFGEFGK
jgi:hypothetical protein